MLKQKVLEWHPVWAGYVFWQSWHGTPDCSQSSASTSESNGCSWAVQCSAGSNLLCPHSCSHSMSMLAFPLVGVLCHRAGEARADPHCGLGQMLGKSQETSKSPRLPQLLLCLVSTCACSSRVQFQFLTLFLSVPLVFRAVNGDSPSSRPYSSGLWFQGLTAHGGHSLYESSLLCALIGVPTPTWTLPFSSCLIPVYHSYSLGCITVFLPDASLFSARVAPDIDIFLICSWGKVSSMSSCSPILISSLCWSSIWQHRRNCSEIFPPKFNSINSYKMN